MEHDFWHGVWERDSIGFHQDDFHPFLKNELPKLVERFEGENSNSNIQGAKVFVPLCGKSLDMLFLAQHFKVIGSELSEIACRDFFSENKIDVDIHQHGEFELFDSERIKLFQGDFFALTKEHVGEVDWVYDRAALIALPPEMRQSYLAHLKDFLSEGTKLFLVTLEYPEHEMDGPPFSVMPDEIQKAFADYRIEEITSNDITGQIFGRRKFKLSQAIERLYLIY